MIWSIDCTAKGEGDFETDIVRLEGGGGGGTGRDIPRGDLGGTGGPGDDDAER